MEAKHYGPDCYAGMFHVKHGRQRVRAGAWRLGEFTSGPLGCVLRIKDGARMTSAPGIKPAMGSLRPVDVFPAARVSGETTEHTEWKPDPSDATTALPNLAPAIGRLRRVDPAVVPPMAAGPKYSP